MSDIVAGVKPSIVTSTYRHVGYSDYRHIGNISYIENDKQSHSSSWLWLPCVV